MKTKKTTKVRTQAQKVKEIIKTGLFFGVPVVLGICLFLMRNSTFNAF